MPKAKVIDSKKGKTTPLRNKPAEPKAEQPVKKAPILNSHPARLTRSETDKIVGGVCGGIAKYLEIDAVIIRILFLILIFGMGVGFLFYIILWVILPSENSIESNSKNVVDDNVQEMKISAEKFATNVKAEVNSNPENARLIVGAFIIFVGFLVMLKVLGVYINFSWLGPVALIVLGLLIILKK